MKNITVTIGGNAITMTKDQAREIAAALAEEIEEGKEPEVAWPYELEYLDTVLHAEHYGVRREMSDGEKPGIGVVRKDPDGCWYADDEVAWGNAYDACHAMWESQRPHWPDGVMERAGFTLEDFPMMGKAWETGKWAGYSILLHGGAGSDTVPSLEGDQFFLEVFDAIGEQVQPPAVIVGRTNALTVVSLLEKVLGK